MIIALGLVEVLAGGIDGIWLAIVGWFILEAGRAEDQRAETRRALADVTVGTLMTRTPVTVGADWTLAEVANRLAGTPRHSAYPAVDDGTVIGLLPLHALAQTGGPDVLGTPRARLRRPRGRPPALLARDPGDGRADELVASGVGRAVVIDRGTWWASSR